MPPVTYVLWPCHRDGQDAGDDHAQSDRLQQSQRLVEQRDPEVPVYAACEALNVSRASLYRSWQPPVSPTLPPVARVRAPSPRRLGEAERQEILDTLHLPEFADQPPAEVYETLLGRGTYLASIRTMYRVLAEAGETRERRNQRAPQQHAMPSLTATAPNQVWTWDITKLATLQKGLFLMVTGESTADVAIPGAGYTFGQLQMALALADFESLEMRRKLAMRLHLTQGMEQGLAEIEQTIMKL